MVETLVEKKECGSCGSEVRDGSAYCFNCGGPVVVEPPPPAILKPSSGPFKRSRSAAETARLNQEPEPPPVSPPVSPLDLPVNKAASLEGIVTIVEEVPEKALTTPQPNRAPRARIQKPKEVEWVEHQSSSAVFLIVAIVFALISGLLVAASFYMR